MLRIARPAFVFGTALLVSLLAVPAAGDTIKMKDGTVHEGKITSETETQVVIDLPDLGSLPIARDKIESITKDEEAKPETTGDEAGSEETPATGDEASGEAADGEAGDETDAETEAEAAERRRLEEERTASERLERRLAARIVRTVKARKPRTEKPDASTDEDEPEDAREATIGGKVLSNVEAGTKVIVFQPPAQFEAAPEMIDIGRRQAGEMLMVGTATAWLGVDGPEGVRKVGLRLADVQRHVEIRSPSSRARIIEGVSPGDWIRVVTKDGKTYEGRLKGYSAGGLKLANPEAEPVIGPDGERQPAPPVTVNVLDVVELDGFLRNRNVHQALEAMEERELISIVRWPSGEELLGRFVALENDRVMIDLDEDGAPDTELHAEAPIAQVRRAPLRMRRDLRKAALGDWMKFTTEQRFEDAEITRIYRGELIGVTAHAVCIATEDGATVVPLDEVTETGRLTAVERNRLKRHKGAMPPDEVRSDLQILPGVEAARAVEVDAMPGASAITSGRTVSHVFVSSPFPGDVFGIKLGMDAVTSARDSELDFDTIVVPRRTRREAYRPTEMISDSLDGLRLTLLVDGAGNVSAMEISARD